MIKLRQKIFLCIVLVVLAGTDSACWYYSFTGKSLPGIESIAIPLFIDRSNETQIRDKLQSSLITTFQDENILKVVSENTADAVLNGVIESVDDVPTALTKEEQARQFELRISVLVRLEKRETGESILSERVTGTGFYQDLGARDEAVDEALEQLTRDISDKIVSNW